jgi:hypothetical protein
MTEPDRQKLYHDRWAAKRRGEPMPPLPPGTRGRHGNQRSGSEHYRWTSARIVAEHGYVKVRVGNTHPLADDNGYAYEHQLVAIAAIGRALAPGEVVHHRNENKTDNRWENLEVLTSSEHTRRHALERHAARRMSGPRPGQGEDALGEVVQEFPGGDSRAADAQKPGGGG